MVAVKCCTSLLIKTSSWIVYSPFSHCKISVHIYCSGNGTNLCNDVISVCIFIGCWLWSIKGHTQMTSNPRQRTCFSFSMPPETFNKPFEFRDRSQKTSQRVKNNSYATRLHFVLYPLWRHTYGKCNQTYFSPKTKIIPLLFIYQMSFFAEQLYLVLALRVCFLLCSWYRLVKNLVEWKTFSFIWKSLYILCFLSLIILQFVYNLLQNLGGTVALLQWG